MKFYLSKGGINTASPYMVRIENGLSLTYMDEDAFPYVITPNRIIFGGYGTEHNSVEARLSENTPIVVEGRLWVRYMVMTNWSYRENTDAMKRLAVDFKTRLNLNPNEIRFFVDCIVGRNERHGVVHFVVETTLSEFTSLNIVGNMSEFFWDLMNKENLAKEKIKPTANGMNPRDVWRHYEKIEETHKLSREKLRKIVNEIITKLKNTVN